MVGNAAVLRCRIPSFVADLVTVNSWQDGDGRSYFPASSHGNLVLTAGLCAQPSRRRSTLRQTTSTS